MWLGMDSTLRYGVTDSSAFTKSKINIKPETNNSKILGGVGSLVRRFMVLDVTRHGRELIVLNVT